MKRIMEVRPSILLRLFGGKAAQSRLVIGVHFLQLEGASGVNEIPYEEVAGVGAERFLFWRKISVHSKSNTEHSFGWVTASVQARIEGLLRSQINESAEFSRRNAQNSDTIQAFDRWYLSASGGNRWVSFSEIRDALNVYSTRLAYLWATDPSDLPKSKANLVQHLKCAEELKRDPDAFRIRCNARFETEELKRFDSFFNSILSRPLTLEQRRAVIVDEDAELVVAAAGSGKTTTIKAKVAYLVKKGLASPSQIQIISFNKNVQLDLERSLADQYPGINISTFHALGLKILAATRGYKPSLSELAETREKLATFLDGVVAEIFRDEPQQMTDFFVECAKPYRDMFDFKGMGEYIAYVRSVGLLTLNGETVKSLEELELANFLFINQINYRYEPAYEHYLATEQRRQYKPDFYLPDYGIYIEHFAINADGRTPHFINEAEYLRSREWKIQTHQAYGTKLIQTYSYEKRAGVLTSNLRDRLEKLGVEFHQLPMDQIFDRLNSTGYISEFGMLLATFLNLFKGSTMTLEDLAARVPAESTDAVRATKFLAIFHRVFDSYQSHLESSSEIDFNDMIRLAGQSLTESGIANQEIKYVLIDEFQDTSIGKAQFVKALIEAAGQARLMVVGDDWQSIYRFSGSDIRVMTSFQEYFGRHEVRYLSETFRFGEMVEAVASRFIMKNSAQIMKKVVARADDGVKSVILWHPKKEGGLLESIVTRLPASSGRTLRVLVLARYNFYKDQLGIEALAKQRKDLDFRFSSIHAAKGSEADVVVLVGMRSGHYSFPSEIADDPLLDLVLSEEDHFEHAEERRLLYVALTRTKSSVYVVGDPGAESVFFSELMKDPDVDTTYLGAAVRRRCSACQALMLERRSQHGLFFGCSNYPVCTMTSRPCLTCGLGFLVRTGVYVSCDNPKCRKDYEACPQCEDGLLVRREGRYGPFWGCTNYSTGSCEYTRNIDPYR